MKSVDRDATHTRDHAAKILVVGIKFRREYQHRVVERELGFRGRGLPQGFNTLRNPDILLLRFGRLGCESGEDGCQNKEGQFHTKPRECDGILSRARTESSREIRTPEPAISCPAAPDESPKLRCRLKDSPQ